MIITPCLRPADSLRSERPRRLERWPESYTRDDARVAFEVQGLPPHAFDHLRGLSEKMGWNFRLSSTSGIRLEVAERGLETLRTALVEIGFTFGRHLLRPERDSTWKVKGGRVLELNRRPLVMAIINVTPDSFFDGGHHATPEAAVAFAEEAVRDGADLLDVGGESTRPGAGAVDIQEQLRRVIPVIETLSYRFPDIPVSVDTRSAEVARQALMAGACIINDVSGLQADPHMATVAAQQKAGLVVMHMRGSPQDMQQNTAYQALIGEIFTHLGNQLVKACDAGLDPSYIVLDPGIGFSKSPEANLTLLRELSAFSALSRPLLIGASRKSFLGRLLGYSPEERLEGSLAAAAVAIYQGAAILRVHDVRETRRLADTVWMILKADDDASEDGRTWVRGTSMFEGRP